MDMSDTMTRPRYDPGHYPVSGKNEEADGRKRWAPMPVKERKEEAARLVNLLLTGERRAQALFWVRRRRYTPAQLENFIASMNRGLAAREQEINARQA
jgi:hypothetical protein